MSVIKLTASQAVAVAKLIKAAEDSVHFETVLNSRTVRVYINSHTYDVGGRGKVTEIGK